MREMGTRLSHRIGEERGPDAGGPVVAGTGQGLAGVEQAVIVGLVFGAICAITGSLFTLMFAHVAFDVTAVTIIYYNLEFKVAHFIFK